MVEENLIREFIAEAEEQVFTLEPNLLRLEKEPHNSELVNEIFLATHNIKGTASYVGLSHISHFTHSLESLLDLLRKGSIQISSGLIDALLQGVDTLKLLIQHVTLGQPAPDTTAIVRSLAQWQPPPVVSEPILPSSSVVGQHAESPVRAQHSAALTIRPQDVQQLDPEDIDVFADIVGQQLELMEFSLDKIREWEASDDDTNRQEAIDAFIAIRKAFQKITSSAAILDFDAVNDMLTTHQNTLAAFEESSSRLEQQDVEEIARMIDLLRDITAMLVSYPADEEREELHRSQPTPEMPTSSSPAFEIAQGHTLRVDAERIDHLLNLVGELIINRARLVQIGQDIKALYDGVRSGSIELHSNSSAQKKKNIRTFKTLKDHFDEITQVLGRLTNQMQEGTMRIRMMPISLIVNRFPRMVHDLSRQAGKDVDVRIYGAETELDKTVIDMLGDPLIHIIRNAIDHGIEMPEMREALGKSRCGMITIAAYHEGNQVIIEIEDDGKGIDAQRVTQKALQQHLITPQEAENLPQHEMLLLIFRGGFSTVDTVSSLSGRGVGLNVVKRYLEKMSGAIELESTPGRGCKFIMRLPLTLAIIPALMVRVKTEIFAIPLTCVEEAIRIIPQAIKTIESHKVIRLRERMIPLFDLTELFGATVFEGPSFSDREGETIDFESEEEQMYSVIVSDGFKEIGILVDAFLGESDIVIKPLNDDLVNVDGISGASIRGDGQVSLVIDPASLITLAVQQIQQNHRARSDTQGIALCEHGERQTSSPTVFSP